MKSEYANLSEIKHGARSRELYYCSLLPLLALLSIGLATLNDHVNRISFVLVQRLAAHLPDSVWTWITILGTGHVVVALAALLLLFRPSAIVAGCGALPFAAFANHVIKWLAATPRPAAVLPIEQIHIIGIPVFANAFPSGHAINAFALASVVALSARRPLRMAKVTLPLASLIAVSRIAVGAHWPIDIAFGACFGWMCGVAGTFLTRQYQGWRRPAIIRATAVCLAVAGLALLSIDFGAPNTKSLQQALALIVAGTSILAIAKPQYVLDAGNAQ